MKPAFGRKLLLVPAALFVTAIAIELLLQGAAVVVRLTNPQEVGIASEAADTSQVRILCIGESTTRGFGRTPYPTILADELNARGYGRFFRVYNAGLMAGSTPGLIEQLPALLDQTRPHMVIAMMGVNDPFYFSQAAERVIPVGIETALLRSRLYKLLRLISWNLRARANADAVPGVAPRRSWEALTEFQRRSNEVHALWKKRQLASPGTVLPGLIAAARALDPPEPDSGSATIAVPREALRSYYHLHSDLAEHHLERGDEAAAIRLYREAIALHPEAEFFYRGLSGVYDRIGEDALSADLRIRADRIADRQMLVVTRESYRELRRMLDERGIELVAMQYPLRNVRHLRHMLDDADDVVYVDNEEIFRTAVAESGYDALFFDQFAGDFGHCTERGNRLIVENLIETVFEPAFGRSRSR